MLTSYHCIIPLKKAERVLFMFVSGSMSRLLHMINRCQNGRRPGHPSGGWWSRQKRKSEWFEDARSLEKTDPPSGRHVQLVANNRGMLFGCAFLE